MWPQSYWPNSYWNKFYWEKTGVGGFIPPVVVTSGASQLLPIMGIGMWLLIVMWA